MHTQGNNVPMELKLILSFLREQQLLHLLLVSIIVFIFATRRRHLSEMSWDWDASWTHLFGMVPQAAISFSSLAEVAYQDKDDGILQSIIHVTI